MKYSYVPESAAGEAQYHARTVAQELPPPPVVSSRDMLPRNFVFPSPVFTLAQYAAGEGWIYRAQYSRGYAVKYRGAWQEEELCALRFERDTYGAFAIYRTIAGRNSWIWRDVWMWGSTLLPFGQGNVTDLRDWLAAGGEQPELWYRVIVARVAEQDARRKQAARDRPKKSNREGM